MSAIDDTVPIIKVLFAIHPSVSALDVLGAYEVLTQALHNPNDPSKSPSLQSRSHLMKSPLPSTSVPLRRPGLRCLFESQSPSFNAKAQISNLKS
jgi:hypothetical protein